MIAVISPGTMNTSEEHHEQAVGPEPVPRRQPRRGQEPLEERRAVERRDREQVEQPEQQVHDREGEDDLDEQVVAAAVEGAAEPAPAVEQSHRA